MFEEPELESDEAEGDLAQAGQMEASLEELLAKRNEAAAGEEDDESLLEMTREERMESLSIRAVPKQPNEFVCSSCHLVKHNSQLADAGRGLCRDCV